MSGRVVALRELTHATEVSPKSASDAYAGRERVPVRPELQFSYRCLIRSNWGRQCWLGNRGRVAQRQGEPRDSSPTHLRLLTVFEWPSTPQNVAKPRNLSFDSRCWCGSWTVRGSHSPEDIESRLVALPLLERKGPPTKRHSLPVPPAAKGLHHLHQQASTKVRKRDPPQ